mgnify:CR=1 FL=1|jgi:hypothetical protein
MSDWEDGFIAGWKAGVTHVGSPRRQADSMLRGIASRKVKAIKPKRKASAASKRYGAAFKRLAPKYKKKAGGWKKDGFKRCAAAARKAAKK